MTSRKSEVILFSADSVILTNIAAVGMTRRDVGMSRGWECLGAGWVCSG